MTGAPPNDMTRLTHLACGFVCVLRVTGRGSLSPFSSPSFWRYFHFAPNFFACGGHQDVHRAAAEPASAAAESAAAQLATAAALASAATALEHAAAMTAAILAALPMSLPLSPQPVSPVALAARRSSPTPPFHPLLLPPDARNLLFFGRRVRVSGCRRLGGPFGTLQRVCARTCHGSASCLWPALEHANCIRFCVLAPSKT